MESYWASPSVEDQHTGANYFSRRMGINRWKEILHCLDCDLLVLCDLVNERIQKYWNCSFDVSFDETMSPWQGRRNPHHVHIPGKPYENGIKEKKREKKKEKKKKKKRRKEEKKKRRKKKKKRKRRKINKEKKRRREEKRKKEERRRKKKKEERKKKEEKENNSSIQRLTNSHTFLWSL